MMDGEYRWISFGALDAPGAVEELRRELGGRVAEVLCHPDDLPGLQGVLPGVVVVATERRGPLPRTVWVNVDQGGRAQGGHVGPPLHGGTRGR